MVIKVNFLQPCGIQKLYDVVAKEFNLDPSHLRYDPKCIFVGESIFEKVKEYYMRNGGYSEISFGMDWACYGPKVDKNLKPFEVNVQDGFFINNS